MRSFKSSRKNYCSFTDAFTNVDIVGSLHLAKQMRGSNCVNHLPRLGIFRAGLNLIFSI